MRFAVSFAFPTREFKSIKITQTTSNQNQARVELIKKD